jgi:hypothetical protein
MSDGTVVRFHVLSRDPIAVRIVGDAPAGTGEAIEEWLSWKQDG